MKEGSNSGNSVLMIAYTNYRTDPRVIRAAEAAVHAGFDVDVLVLRRTDDPDVEVINGARIIHLHQYRYRGGGLFRYMLAYLQFFIRCFFKGTCLYLQKQYRVIHVNNIPDFLVFCTLVPKLLGARVILDIHDPMPNTFASKFKAGEHGFYFKFLLWQELASAHYADRVVTVHDPLKDLVLVKHGLPADSIHVIANFADDDVFRLRPDYDADGKLRMIFHGTILERYGLHTLLEAISKVKSRDKISLRIIGEGDFSEQLAGLIVSLKLEDIVTFENRAFPLHQIPAVIADANLGLVPLEISSITNYALPLKLLEYISMGLPVATVRNAAIGYYFGDDDCMFYRSDDVESLRALIDRVANDRDVLRHYRQKSVALRGKFLWSNERQKYITLLNELAQRN
jgi:glycosyltransferase involved in cell wall biosynthesis